MFRYDLPLLYRITSTFFNYKKIYIKIRFLLILRFSLYFCFSFFSFFRILFFKILVCLDSVCKLKLKFVSKPPQILFLNFMFPCLLLAFSVYWQLIKCIPWQLPTCCHINTTKWPHFLRHLFNFLNVFVIMSSAMCFPTPPPCLCLVASQSMNRNCPTVIFW